jgi:hypothetical protein
MGLVTTQKLLHTLKTVVGGRDPLLIRHYAKNP